MEPAADRGRPRDQPHDALQQDPRLDVTRGVQPFGTQRQLGSSTPKKEPLGILNNDLWAIALSIID